MDWTNETVLRFLELYRNNPCIWDPKNPSYKNKNVRYCAWVDIKNNLGESCSVKELKKKRESLMSAYRAYRTKIKKSEGTSDVYQPTWFAYSLMDSFLGGIYKCNLVIEDNQHHHDKDDSNTELDDTGDTNTIETDCSNPDQDSSYTLLQSGPKSQEFLSSRSAFKRRCRDPIKYQQIKDQMDRVYDSYTHSNENHKDDDDECNIFGMFIAKKLRKLPEDRRDLMMMRIIQLFYEECHEDRKPSFSS